MQQVYWFTQRQIVREERKPNTLLSRIQLDTFFVDFFERRANITDKEITNRRQQIYIYAMKNLGYIAY